LLAKWSERRNWDVLKSWIFFGSTEMWKWRSRPSDSHLTDL
jgi:hypothetical protein